MEINDFNGKIVNVIGIGVSNVPLIKTLYNWGAYIIARDKKEIENFKDKSIFDKYCKETYLGQNYLDNIRGDYIFRSPGIRYDKDEFLNAASNGIQIISEMELFLSLCKGKTIGVTGSDGKTTTTTLIYEILKQSGYSCYLGGNIGIPSRKRLLAYGE